MFVLLLCHFVWPKQDTSQRLPYPGTSHVFVMTLTTYPKWRFTLQYRSTSSNIILSRPFVRYSFWPFIFEKWCKCTLIVTVFHMKRWGECAGMWTCMSSVGGSGRKEVQAGSNTRHLQHPREQRRGGSQPPPWPPAPLPVFPAQQIRQSAVVEFHVRAALTLFPIVFFFLFVLVILYEYI